MRAFKIYFNLITHGSYSAVAKLFRSHRIFFSGALSSLGLFSKSRQKYKMGVFIDMGEKKY